MKQTKIPFSEFGWIRPDREFLAVALVFGMALAPFETIKATDAPVRPIKDLSQANDQLSWPQDLNPSNGDSFVHNEIWINAPARVIWQNLIDAKNWPKWYSNAADVQINGSEILTPDATFTWKTFGFPVTSKIHEFVPGKRIGWYGQGTGILAYHSWLIIEKNGGCQVVTEEAQVGPSAVKFNVEQPTAMSDGHHWWLSALKVRSESSVANELSPHHARLGATSTVNRRGVKLLIAKRCR
jgi:Polyketide cyclase / dehydrase and lipid transport